MYKKKHSHSNSRNIGITVFIFLLLPISMTSAEEKQSKDPLYNTKEKVTQHDVYSHWSLNFDAGFNAFDGDFSSEKRHAVFAPALGIGVEYSFTPLLGIGLDYMFDMYRVFGDASSGLNADILLGGFMHKAGLYLSVDMLRAFAPKSNQEIAALHLFAGGGGAFYRNAHYYRPEQKRNTNGCEAMSQNRYSATPYMNVGLDLEFNLSRSIALGLRAQYSYFTKDDVDERYPMMHDGQLLNEGSMNNDGIFDVTLSMRYKIDAVHKKHVRNVSWTEYMGYNEQEQFDGIKDRIKDTLYIYRKDTIYNEIVVRSKVYDKSYFVYFDNESAKLTDQSLITLQQAASAAADDTDAYLAIIGYCDNTGPVKLNDILGEKRGDNVAKELAEEYGISPERMYVCSKGSIVSRSGKKAYSANRRAEIRLVSKEEFELFKRECENTQDSAVIGVELHEEKRENILAKEEVVTGTTLGRLARKYYKNTHCWVYIYQANKEFINNPNRLPIGIILKIPSLTHAQCTITKDQCLELYNNVRN